jgi:hypothetical protein
MVKIISPSSRVDNTRGRELTPGEDLQVDEQQE